MATVVRRAGARPWQVRYYDHAGQRRSRQFTRKADATAFAAEVGRSKETGRLHLLDADRKTLSEIGAAHIAAIRHDLAPATLRNYRHFWNGRVLTHPIAATPLRAITPSVLEGFRDDLRADGIGGSSIHQVLVLVGAVLNRAVRDGFIPANPAAAVRKPSGSRRGSVRVIAPDGVERIRARLGGQDALLVSVLAYAGVRPGEARALEWPDVSDRTLRVERATNPDGSLKATKTNHHRTVRLVDALARDLAAARGDATGLIFPRRDGERWRETDWRNWRRRKFTPAAAAAEVPIGRPYDLRHSIASLWLREGIDVVQVARWLGHSPAMTLSTYAHVIEDIDPADRTPADDLIEAARA